MGVSLLTNYSLDWLYHVCGYITCMFVYIYEEIFLHLNLTHAACKAYENETLNSAPILID